jgi:hypothetical protein
MFRVKNCNECKRIAGQWIAEIEKLIIENARLESKLEELQKRADFLEKLALREARDVMCEYCEHGEVIVESAAAGVYVECGKIKLKSYFYKNDIEHENINYCPMCGRKLEAQDAQS